MKKSFYFLPLIACISYSSCNSEDLEQIIEEPQASETITLTATTDSKSETRTSIDDECKVYWSPGENIGVFFYKKQFPFSSLNSEPVRSANFVGQVSSVIGNNDGSVSTTDSYNFWAVYPFNANAVLDGNSLSTTLAHKQVAVEGSFAEHTFPAVARSKDYSVFNFKNVGSILRFTIGSNDIQTIKVKSNNGEALAGSYSVAFTDDSTPVPYITNISSGYDEVVLNAPYGETLKSGSTYSMVVLPCDLSEGFTVYYCKENSSEAKVFTLDESVSFERNKYYNFNRKDDVLSFEETGIVNSVYPEPAPNQVFYKSIEDGKLIRTFWTANEGNTCLSNVYDSSTGYCVLTFSGDVLSLTTKDSYTIKENLKEIILPEGLVTIPDEAFRECYHLESVVLPETLKEIRNRAFFSTDLRNLVVPRGVRVIGESAFSYSKILGPLVLDNAEIYNNAFLDAQVSEVYLGANCKYIGSEVFGNEFSTELFVKKITIDNPDIEFEYDSFLGMGLTVTNGDFFKNIPYIIENGELVYVAPLIGQTLDLTGLNVTSITNLKGNYSLKKIIAPDCTYINSHPSGNTVLGYDYFGFVRNFPLEEIYLSNVGVTIGDGAFDLNTNLKIVSGKILNVEGGAFRHTFLDPLNTSIDLSNATYIGDGAFGYCAGLTNLDLSSATFIGSGAFQGCENLRNVDISNLQNIGDYDWPFNECNSLQEIDIPSSLQIFDSYKRIEGCTNLSTIKCGMPDKIIMYENNSGNPINMYIKSSTIDLYKGTYNRGFIETYNWFDYDTGAKITMTYE